jgi:lipopolysaccharide transport system ATP-binding protein
MSDDVLIKIENVSKKFCRSLKRSMFYGIGDIARDLINIDTNSHNLRRDEFWAVEGVSFELKRGECLGIVGMNGAGKSTLLKILNGIFPPDTGKITIKGKVAALIEVGAGFHPMLTGRENIYINGSILGVSKKEIHDNFDEIVEFAGLEDFIDTPVKYYSSGMYVRLGFSISTILQPDILILDEILAVGDAAFKHKCLHRMSKIINHSAVILVSHSMDQIAAISSKVLMLRSGKAELYENTSDGISAYQQDNLNGVGGSVNSAQVFYPPVSRVKVNIITPEVQYGESLIVDILIESEENIPNVSLSFSAVNDNEQPAMIWQSKRSGKVCDILQGKQMLKFKIEPLLLSNGIYRWNFNMLQIGSVGHKIWFMRAGHFTVTSPFRSSGTIPYMPDSKRFELIRI